MEFIKIGEANLSLEMQTVEHYRELAQGYRSSEEYLNMIGLYPALQTSIQECRNEAIVQ